MNKNIDIKSLSVFNGNSGLDKIKKASQKKDNAKKEESFSQRQVSIPKPQKKTVKVNSKGAGAPVKQFDRVFASKAPLKLSAVLNSTSRNLVEKYETNSTRDELLRKALDEYIRQNLSLEDKMELYRAVLKDLDIFRDKFPTIQELDESNNIIRTVEEIEKETEMMLKKNWGLK